MIETKVPRAAHLSPHRHPPAPPRPQPREDPPDAELLNTPGQRPGPQALSLSVARDASRESRSGRGRGSVTQRDHAHRATQAPSGRRGVYASAHGEEIEVTLWTSLSLLESANNTALNKPSEAEPSRGQGGASCIPFMLWAKTGRWRRPGTIAEQHLGGSHLTGSALP